MIERIKEKKNKKKNKSFINCFVQHVVNKGNLQKPRETNNNNSNRIIIIVRQQIVRDLKLQWWVLVVTRNAIQCLA